MIRISSMRKFLSWTTLTCSSFSPFRPKPSACLEERSEREFRADVQENREHAKFTESAINALAPRFERRIGHEQRARWLVRSPAGFERFGSEQGACWLVRSPDGFWGIMRRGHVRSTDAARFDMSFAMPCAARLVRPADRAAHGGIAGEATHRAARDA